MSRRFSKWKGKRTLDEKKKNVEIQWTRLFFIVDFVVDCKEKVFSGEIRKMVAKQEVNENGIRIWIDAKWSYESVYKVLVQEFGMENVQGIPDWVLKEVNEMMQWEEKNSVKIKWSRFSDETLEKLKDFQKKGIERALQYRGIFLMADDMGTGKTIQSLMVCNYYKKDWPVFIVTQSSIREHWKREIRTWTDATRIRAIEKKSDYARSSDQFVVCSYTLASTLQDNLSKFPYGIIILDESHNIKTPKSKRTKACIKLVAKAKRKILLSGTASISRPIEIYCQMKALGCKWKLQEFGKRYCKLKQGMYGMDYTGSCNLEELHSVLLICGMIRRTKEEVLTDLPQKTRHIVKLDLNSTEKDQYKATKQRFSSESDSKTMELYKLTSEVKQREVINFIRRNLKSSQDEKIIVFAHHLSMLNRIEAFALKRAIGFIRIDGSTSHRQKLIDNFRNDKNKRLAILSLQACSTGLNFSFCQKVIFAELSWTTDVLQAEDRCHRMGQTKPVEIYYLIAKGTMDPYIWNMIKKKLQVVGTVLDSKGSEMNAIEKVVKKGGQMSILPYLIVGGSSQTAAKTGFPKKKRKLDI